MILFIIEGPGKLDKISKILGPGYLVMATAGHIIDLDPNTMSIDIEHDFTPQYKVSMNKTSVISNLKKAFKDVTDVLLAADEDREGEMIAWSVAFVLGLKNAKRITYKSITKTDIMEAIKQPRKIDMNLVNAQKTRRMLDRIVGYQISPVLNNFLKQHNLSAGRVQSVVAKLIIDKENEIKQFFTNEDVSFFKIKGIFVTKTNKTLNATLYDLEKIVDEGVFKGTLSKIQHGDQVKLFLEKCASSTFKINNIIEKKSTQSPSPPFITSTLQQEASRKFGFNAKRTMDAAQKLYEEGHITYLRTDSVNLSDEGLNNIKKYVIDTYGEDYYRHMQYKSKTKNAQEAHEAIRPTDVFVEKVELNEKITYDCIKLYQLIWKRTVASQMKPAEYSNTYIQITLSKDSHHYFEAMMKVLTFHGFLKVYNIANLEKDDHEEEDEVVDNKDVPCPNDEIYPHEITGAQEYKRPPVRFNDASLINIMDGDHLNIGRPATTESIINKIISRGYVKKDDIVGVKKESIIYTWKPVGEVSEEKPVTRMKLTSKLVLPATQQSTLSTPSTPSTSTKSPKSTTSPIIEKTKTITLGEEKNNYVPTSLGVLVNDFLVKNFVNIMDYKFTAKMEEDLDKIACGELKWVDVMKEFYTDFHPHVVLATNQNSLFSNQLTRSLGVDSKTGYEVVATVAKYGPVVKMFKSPTEILYAPIKDPYNLETITLSDAIKLFEFPKDLGIYNKQKVILSKGQYGLYITCGAVKCSLEANKEHITLEEAIEALNNKNKQTVQNKTPLAEFKNDARVYKIFDGPYGKYIKMEDIQSKKTINVSLPENTTIEGLTLESVTELVINGLKNPVYKKSTGGSSHGSSQGSSYGSSQGKSQGKQAYKKPFKKAFSAKQVKK